MSFFVKNNKSSFVLLVSLKSSSIDFQLIKKYTEEKKEVLFLEQNIILLQNSQDPKLYTDQYMKEFTKTLDTTHLKIKQLIGKSPLQIYFSLHAPWFTSKIETLFYKESIILNKDFVKKELDKTGTDSKLKTLEKQIVKIKTNGYTITEIHNLKCSDVEINIYSSYISFEIHNLLIEILKKYFPHSKEPKFCTSPLTALDNIKRFMVKEDNIIFLNIGAEITELGIIEDDALSNFSTYPIGIHDFLRTVQTNIKTYDYDLLYQKEILLKSQDTQLQFDTLKQNWVNSFLQTLDFLKAETPHKIVLICDSKVKDFFTLILSNSIKQDSQINVKKYRIINFDISLLKDIITYKTPVGENELNLKLEALI
jgi:hypothetical protein